ncbi:MAG TPA: hypothetical protein VF042_00425 [Gemmatimonadaceae bacterium]
MSKIWIAALIVTMSCAKQESAPLAATDSLPSAPVSSSAEDKAALASYTLDMEKINKLSAFMANAASYRKSHPGEDLEVSLDATDDLDTSIQKIESNTAAKQLLTESGLTAREYVLLVSAYLGAGMTVTMLDTNPNAKIPDNVNPKNVEFIRTHKAELDQMKKAMEENE